MRLLNLMLGDKGKLSGWVKAKNISEATLKEYQEANLRELYNNEVILDSESKMQSRVIKKQLDKEQIGYEMWDTSSRGSHFHIYIKGLQALTPEERLLYREHWINKYHTDMKKKSGFIAMEHRPHLKTGLYKTLKHKNNIINSIDMDLVHKIKLQLEKKKPKYTNESHTNITDIKRNIKPSDLWIKWGLSKKGNGWDTPFAISKSKTSVKINDDKGVWYDHNTEQGGDIITAVQLKYNCCFIEALTRLQKGDY